jgi:O-antigen/teichoic acid export membrane protein
MAKIAQPFILAMLSRVQDDRAKFDAQAALALQVMLCVGAAAAFAFTLLGPFIFELAFGEKMREGTAYVVPIGIAFSALLIQSGSLVPLSLARGRTINPFLSNLVRLAALPIGFAIVLSGGSVLDLTMVMIAGETASGITGAVLAATRVKTSAPFRTLPAYLFGLSLLAVLTYSAFAGLGGLWITALQAALLLLTVLACGDLRRFALAEARARLTKTPA